MDRAFPFKVLGMMFMLIPFAGCVTMVSRICLKAYLKIDDYMISTPLFASKSWFEIAGASVSISVGVAFFVLVIRMVIVNKTILFTSRRSIRIHRAGLLIVSTIMAGILLFFFSQASVSFGSGGRNAIKNSFRFASEHGWMVRNLSPDLTVEEKKINAASLERYRTPEAFAAANAKVNGQKKAKGRTVTAVMETQAGAAMRKAVTKVYRVLTDLFEILLFIALIMTFRLLLSGFRAWGLITEENTVFRWHIRLLCCLISIPMALIYGFLLDA